MLTYPLISAAHTAMMAMGRKTCILHIAYFLVVERKQLLRTPLPHTQVIKGKANRNPSLRRVGMNL